MPKNLVTINEAMCKSCLLCAAFCPKKILALDTGKVNVKGYNPVKCTDQDACTACAVCGRMCPDSVIRVERDVS